MEAIQEKISLSFSAIRQRIKSFNYPDVDLVIGIGQGGTVPAALIAYELDLPLRIIQINYRDMLNNPIYPSPRVLGEFRAEISELKILLVDDVSVSGKTLETAKVLLCNNEVNTLVLKGNADFVLFPEVKKCVKWPWNSL